METVHKAGALVNLSNNARREYLQNGQTKYLDQAIDLGHQALGQLYYAATVPGPGLYSGEFAAIFFNDLSNKISLHYERTLELRDLHRSIHLAQTALNFSRIGHALPGKPESEDVSIEPAEGVRQAGSLDTSKHDSLVEINLAPGDPLYLSNLGSRLFVLYLRIRRLPLLKQAIEAISKAINMCLLAGEDSAPSPKMTSILAECYCERYRALGDAADIYTARTLALQSWQVMVATYRPFDIPFVANSVANAMLMIYSHNNLVGDLKMAISTCRYGLSVAPPQHTCRPRCLNILGMALEQLSRTTSVEVEAESSLKEACEVFLEAWRHNSASLVQRACAITNLLPLLAERREFQLGTQVTDEAVALVQDTANQWKARGDRQYALGLFSPVAAQGCAILVGASTNPGIAELNRVLRHLEQTRAVILGQLLENRRVTRQMRDIVPSFALIHDRNGNDMNIDGFNEMKLHQPYDPGPPFAEVHHREQIMAQLKHNWDDESRQKIRKEQREDQKKGDAKKQRDFEKMREFQRGGPPDIRRFLRPQASVEEIQANIAPGGTLVVVNATRSRSDAIIVARDIAEVVPLDSDFETVASSHLAARWDGGPGRAKRDAGNDNLMLLLQWLWKSCVQRVISRIRASGDTKQERPRIWWLGTGTASALPFHAAGIYDRDDEEHTENAYHRTLSSYTSSIGTLLNFSRPVPPRDTGSLRVMIASMPTAPELANLSGVTDEARAVRDAIPPSYPPPLELEHPSSSQVQERLRVYNVVHFACHGIADPLDPSQSGMVFQQADAPGKFQQDPLTVLDVSNIDLRQDGSIAYLSACSTAENKASALSEESLSVVTGFQAAGFRHVVGCLWPSNDAVCALVAGEFYTVLFKAREGGTGWDQEGAVVDAWRRAIMRCWKRRLLDPFSWVQFVHYGP